LLFGLGGSGSICVVAFSQAICNARLWRAL